MAAPHGVAVVTDSVRTSSSCAKLSIIASAADDLDALPELRADTLAGNTARAAKRARSDAAYRSRTRGREC